MRMNIGPIITEKKEKRKRLRSRSWQILLVFPRLLFPNGRQGKHIRISPLFPCLLHILM